MLLSKLLRYFVSGLLMCLGLHTASAAKLENQAWIEITSNNFSMYSTLEEREATELLYNVELLRAAVPVLTNIEPAEASVPTIIISVKSAVDFRKLGIGNRFLGLFGQGLRQNHMLVRDSKFQDGSSTLLHEYVHYITRNGRAQNYPRWFTEGFAEYFSSAQLNEGNYEVGRFPHMRRRSFRDCDWMPTKRIIGDTGQGGCMFYAGSWATVHYIQTLPDHATMMADYLRRTEAGEDRVEAFVEAFGTDIAAFNRRIKDYVKKGKFSYISLKAGELLDNFKIAVRPVFKEEMSLILAEAALRLAEYKQARTWFEIAGTDEQFAARAQSGIGKVYQAQDDFAAAEEYFNRAYEMGPDDVEVLIDLGRYWTARAGQLKGEDKDKRDHYLKAARKYIGKSWKLDDTRPETYAAFGRSYMVQKAFEQSVDTLEAANRLLPSNSGVRLSLATSYFELGRHEEAKSHAQAVRAWSHGGSSMRESADKLLTKINLALEPSGSESDAPVDSGGD